MNIIFFLIIAWACLTAAFTGSMEAVSKGAMDSAKAAVDLAIGLVGVMTLFLGLMKVVEEAGGLRLVTRMIRPIMVRLFPDVPPDHPAMGAMILNIAANVLGLANAATPFGIRAMHELDKLNGEKGTATNAMALFLAINTSSVTLLPTGVITLRATMGSADPAAILPTTLFATCCSTVSAIIACKLIERLPFFARTRPPMATGAEAQERVSGNGAKGDEHGADMVNATSGGVGSILPGVIGILGLAALVVASFVGGQTVSAWIVPCLIFGMLVFGMSQGVKVYEVFVGGAKEGFNMAIRIIPYMVAILVAVGMFRASGALDHVTGFIGAFTDPLGLPGEAVPMAILRPLSGSGAYAFMAEVMKTNGPDSYVGTLVSTIQGSSETTFYVLAVYFGSIQVSRIRHALIPGLFADLAGVIGAIIACRILFGF